MSASLKKSSLLLLVFSVLIIPLTASAQIRILPDCEPIPGGDNTCGVIHIIKLLVNIFNTLMYLAAFFAIAFMIFAGLRMLYWSFMENSQTELEGAKSTLTRAVAGLVIVILAYVIVNTVIVLIGGGGINEILDKANL